METKGQINPDNLSIIYRNVNTLWAYPGNARKHSKVQLRQIAESIEAFGFNNPILLDKDNVIIAGHGRWKAAQSLGIREVPTIQLANLSEAQKKAYILADNRLAEKAGWDKSILAIEFQNLIELDPAFDLDVTGFEFPEIDILLQGDEEGETDEDEIPPLPQTPVTRLGDTWRLGEHIVSCTDSLNEASYAILLGNRKLDMVFTDPPYNVPINGHVSGRGKTKHGEFAMASGEMSPEEFTQFLQKALTLMARYTKDGSMHFICMDWRHVGELSMAGSKVYTELKNICVWNKDRGGMGSLYRSKHELVFLYKSGTASHINNIELGKHGRNRNNVWDYPAVSALRTGKKSELSMHPTVKPVRMIADAILDCSNIGDTILDPFGGSGSTLMAAEKTKRKAILFEISPLYVDTIVERWQRKTKLEAIHMQTGKTYKEIQTEGRM